ncbi:MAG: thiamine pyrophosphate-requiring protein [Hyphomicrobiaceae bacterium]
MSQNAATPRSVAEAYLALLKQRGIDWLFANAGTDFAPIIEGLVRGRKAGIPMPEAVPIAHETTAVAMAHGYTLMTGRPQAVMVHVNVGLANALMGVVNAARENVPMLVTSGRTPLTEQGLLGSRDLPIHWGQEMFDQAGMLRELVKWEYELRHPAQLQTVVDRALTVATTSAKGPVYLSLPREVLAEPWTGDALAPAPATARPADPLPDPASVTRALDILLAARRPLVIAGRGDPASFTRLGTLAERLGAAVTHFWPARLAMPTTHPLHAGFDVGPLIGEADAILVLDSLVPWIPLRHELAPGCRVVQVGPDPLFARTPVRSFPAEISITSGVAATIAAMLAATEQKPARETDFVARIAQRTASVRTAAARMPAGLATAPWVSHCLDALKGDDAIVFNELGCDPSVMTFTRPDSYFGHPIAGGLGWGMPAALGAKLAAPDRLVVACVGDGSYMFANPVACHQTAAALRLPILTIVFNNAVWNAVRRSTRAVYPTGEAAAVNDMPLSSLSPSPAFEKVVEASDGLGICVEDPADLPKALQRAIAAVRGGQQALLNVRCAIAT